MTFREYLEARWTALQLSQSEFCRRIGKPAGWISQIRQGKKHPPLDGMDAWADALRLTDHVERARFKLLAAAAHIPAAHRAPIEALIAVACP